jgi:apolipoprotein D and lipocalin family protein
MPPRFLLRCRLAAAFCIAIISLAASAGDSDPTQLATIPSLDVPRYMGTWYEIAKFPNWFQKSCIGDTSAEYSLKPDGQVQVINRCRMDSGEMKVAIGAARQIGGGSSPKLEVRFAPAWLSFIPAVWGDYWVIDLDERYQLVAVSEPTRKYLWILSRTPTVEQKAFEALMGRLANKGMDVSRLEPTRQGIQPAR